MTAALAGTLPEPASIERPTLSSERAREMGRLSGAARRKLQWADVERELCFDSPESIRRACEIIARWGCVGLVTGAVAGAAVRGCEVGLRALETSVTYESIEELRRDVARLADERDVARQEVERLTLQLRRSA
jgi:hypothetical protein